MINATNISVFFGDRILLNSVNLVIGERDRIGLVGKNGAGKSTLLKIIAKYQLPDEGNIARPNGTTLGFLHQDLSFPKGKTVLEEALTAFDDVLELEKRIEAINVELGHRTDYESAAYSKLLEELSETNERFQILGGITMHVDAERILKGLGFKSADMHRLTDEFSGGWQMRIELAKILLQRPNYLLLDEPTNHLDIESILWLEGFLKEYSGSVLVISHDKMFLDNVTTRTVEIEFGQLYDYKASYSNYIALRNERIELQKAAYKNQQKEIEKTEKLIERFRYKDSKAKFAQSLIKQLDKMERIEVEDKDSSKMKIHFPPAPRSGEVVVNVKKVVKHYGDLMVLRGVDFQLTRGESIAFVGQNGQGKTTLSKIIAGIEPANKGLSELGYNVKIGYYAQNQAESLDQKLTVLEVMESACPPELRTKVRSILGAFRFSGEDAEKKVSVLSGGERARLALACMLLHPINLLILDEPTNHLDMPSKEVLKEAIKAYDGTLIVVSHDRDFLNGLTDRTLEFRDQQLHNHIGDVTAFLAKRKVDDMRTLSKRSELDKSVVVKDETRELTYEERKELAKERKKLERKVQKAEREIEQKEKNIAKFESQMAELDFYERKDHQITIDKYNKTQEQLESIMESWEAAQMELEEWLEKNE